MNKTMSLETAGEQINETVNVYRPGSTHMVATGFRCEIYFLQMI